LGLALLSQGRTTQAETLFDQALALATTENSAIDMARIYLSKSTTCRIARKVEEAASWCDKADILRQKNLLQSTADRPDWKLLSLDVEWIRSVQALHRVDRIGAEEHLKAMYQTAEELGWPRRGIRVFLALGTLCEMSGRFLEAGEYYRRSIQSLDDFDDTVGCAWAKINYTGLLLNSGRLEQAQTLAAEVIDIEEQLGRGTNLAFAQQLLGCVYLEQAKFSEATELLLRARDAHRSSTRRRAEADTLGDIARLCYTTGHLDEALSHLDQGLAMVDGDDVDRWQLLVTQAMVRARLGLVSEAHESLAALEAFQDRLPTRGKICLQLARASCVWAEARADDKTDSDSCKQNYQAALSLIDELRNSAAVHTSTVARCGLRLLTEKVSSHTRRSE